MAKKRRAKKVTHEIVHPEIACELKHGEDALGIKEVKKMVGWSEEPEGEDWGKDFDLRDKYSKKIRCKNNPLNRPMKPAIVDRYASEFLRGMWHFNGESIVISNTGFILDGQHRAVGFILAEQERHINQAKWGSEPLKFEVLLALGFSQEDKELADSYDKGQARSLSDVIYRHENLGVDDKTAQKISRHLATAIRLVWIRAGGKTISSAPHFPHSEAMEFYSHHKGILDSIKFVIEADGGNEGNEKLLSPLMSLPYCAALHYLMSDIDEAKADDFWLSLASGSGLEKGSPILVLRSILTKSEASSGKDRDKITISTIKAWIAFLAGESVTPKALKVKQKKEADAKGNEKFVFAEYPRIGGIDEEKESPEKLKEQEQLILSALADSSEPLVYSELVEATGLSKAAISKLVATGTGETLEAKGFVKAEVIENDDDKSPPVQVSITPAGRKQVR